MSLWLRTVWLPGERILRGADWNAMTQATGLPYRHGQSQYEPMGVTEGEALQLRRDPAYTRFFERVRGDMEQALLQNTGVMLFHIIEGSVLCMPVTILPYTTDPI